jgi:hypothetical protein
MGSVFFLSLWRQCCTLYYRLSKNIMDLAIFAITQERTELESCGFHHSTENSVRHKSMSNLIGRATISLWIGNNRRICLILDNATWHHAQTEESKLPKRTWRKGKVEEWLQKRHITYDQDLSKAEILEIAYYHVPQKEYLLKILCL